MKDFRCRTFAIFVKLYKQMELCWIYKVFYLVIHFWFRRLGWTRRRIPQLQLLQRGRLWHLGREARKLMPATRSSELICGKLDIRTSELICSLEAIRAGVRCLPSELIYSPWWACDACHRNLSTRQEPSTQACDAYHRNLCAHREPSARACDACHRNLIALKISELLEFFSNEDASFRLFTAA